MKIHEYQAKEILRSFGVPVPEGILATSAVDAAAAFEKNISTIEPSRGPPQWNGTVC